MKAMIEGLGGAGVDRCRVPGRQGRKEIGLEHWGTTKEEMGGEGRRARESERAGTAGQLEGKEAR